MRTPPQRTSKPVEPSSPSLSPGERTARQTLESRIERGLRHHLEAAQALREIRDSRLYRDEYPSFEDYCAARWQIARSHANRLCDWAEVAENVSPIGDKLPVRESHARPLSFLTQDQQRAAWRRLVEMQNHSERLIQSVCDDVRGQPTSGDGPAVAQASGEGLCTPLTWMGGKQSLATEIVGLLPPHDIYVEAFAGGAAVLFAKPPSRTEIINDVHGGVVNFFRVLRDPDQSSRLRELLDLTPYARDEHDYCRQNPDATDPVEGARRFFVRVRQSFNCEEGGSWARTIDPDRTRIREWWRSVERLGDCLARMKTVQVEHQDFRKLLPECDRPGTVIYADPPYLPDTRSPRGDIYAHEMSEADHVALLDIVCGFRHGRVVLRGYDSPLYNGRLGAWARYEFRRNVKPAARRSESPGAPRSSGFRPKSFNP
jgi:DNA adenine methylase